MNKPLKFCLSIVEGYDMTPMADEVYDEAIADIVGPEEMLSQAVVVKVCDLFSRMCCAN